MATNKQCKMLLARAKEAGMPLTWDQCDPLENGEVDAMIDKIKAYKKPEETPQGANIGGQGRQLNGQRAGMVYKIVRDNWTDKEITANKKEFIAQVVKEYNLASEVEAAITAASSSLFPTKDKHTCDYCKGSFNTLYLLENGSFVCGLCRWKNANDNKADGGQDEVTDPMMIQAQFNKRFGAA